MGNAHKAPAFKESNKRKARNARSLLFAMSNVSSRLLRNASLVSWLNCSITPTNSPAT